jgi:hypothetical protein
MGLPIEHFVAATNVNDTVPRFLKTEFMIQSLLKRPFLMLWT